MPDLISCMSKIGYKFHDSTLLLCALTHTSAVERGRDAAESYERLEFLGDRVIGLLIADTLFTNFTEATAGEMNRRLSALVRRETLADIASELGLGAHIIMSPGEEYAGGRNKPAILADVMEAILAAIYLDGGLSAVRILVAENWSNRLGQAHTAERDPKSALQEWTQANGGGLPEYYVLSRSGVDHAPIFVVACRVLGKETQAEGPSKRAAERAAAEIWFSTHAQG